MFVKGTIVWQWPTSCTWLRRSWTNSSLCHSWFDSGAQSFSLINAFVNLKIICTILIGSGPESKQITTLMDGAAIPHFWTWRLSWRVVGSLSSVRPLYAFEVLGWRCVRKKCWVMCHAVVTYNNLKKWLYKTIMCDI